MKYYKVKNLEYGSKNIYDKKGRFLFPIVEDELYTVKEMEKIHAKYKPRHDLYKFCDLVEIPKSKIYWFFGCRYAS